MSSTIKVLVWDEAPPHAPRSIYPNSINGAIAESLNKLGAGSIQATAVNLDDPSQGITAGSLEQADVLIWWGHARHGDVSDETVALVVNAVNNGLGFIPLHSAHYSKPFKAVLNCSGDLTGGWREATNPVDSEEITVAAPKHPIAEGIDNFVLPEEEMYGAPFGIPSPEVIIFQSHFPLGGEYFPSFVTTVGPGIDPTFTCGDGNGQNRGHGLGRVFYFRPGHETYPTYFDANVQRVIKNAVVWSARRRS